MIAAMRLTYGIVAAAICLQLHGGDVRFPDAQAAPPARAETRARLDTLVGNLHERGLFDGAVVVGDGRDVLWAKGFGEARADTKAKLTPDTLVDGASLAKTFTAALVLRLNEEGRFGLDDPVQRWVPELPYAAITWRHLLSHSSGLPVLDYDYFDKWLPAGQVRTTESLVGVLAVQRPALAFAPGTAFEYSSFGYDIAALAAARVARTTYADLLKARIFRPLGIASAFVRPGRLSEFPGARTLGYRRVNGTLVPNDVFDLEGFHGGSNIYISALDLHRWNASFMEKPVMPPAALTLARQPARIGGAQSGLTLGSWYWSADGAAFWYSGHLQGFHSEVFRDVRTRSSIVYVSNNTIELWLQKALVRAIRSIVAGHDVSPLAAPPVVEIARDAYASLIGEWTMADGERVRVERSGDHLALRRNGVSYRMVQVDPRGFYAPGCDLVIGFAGLGGDAPKISLASNIDERWGERTR